MKTCEENNGNEVRSAKSAANGAQEVGRSPTYDGGYIQRLHLRRSACGRYRTIRDGEGNREAGIA